jgi:hypothetical protein
MFGTWTSLSPDLEARVHFLENLLKSNGVHEFGCRTAIVERHNRRGLSYMHPKECNCWLNGEKLDD